jgi:hypothetical protein
VKGAWGQCKGGSAGFREPFLVVFAAAAATMETQLPVISGDGAMWTCPKCKIEIEPGFDVCWACGGSRDGDQGPEFDPTTEGIIGAEDYAAETEAKRREDLVTLSTFWNAPEAHMVRSRLEAEGIPAVVTDELATTTTWGLLNDSGGVKVEVPEAELERARGIMDSCRRFQPPEERVISKAVEEGIQAEPSPPALPQTDEEPREGPPSPDHLILAGYRTAILGISTFPLLFFLPIPVSLYMLIRAARLPGAQDPAMQRRFAVALTIDIVVMLLWWLPVSLFLLYLLIKWLV